MDSFEFNKFAAAILVALLVGMVSSLIAERIVHPPHQEKKAYIIEVPETQQAGASPADQGPVVEPVDPLLASANVENGKEVAKRCLQCHIFESGGGDKMGPNLWDIVGRPIGKEAGYAYSPAIATKGGEWTYDNLNHFLFKPQGFAKGTKMSFAGLPKVKDRADLIAYLRTLSNSPKPLP